MLSVGGWEEEEFFLLYPKNCRWHEGETDTRRISTRKLQCLAVMGGVRLYVLVVGVSIVIMFREIFAGGPAISFGLHWTSK